MAASGPGPMPALLHHQGRVWINGRLVTGQAGFKFALISLEGGQVYWTNSPDDSPADGQPDVPVVLALDHGLYSVLLGDTNLAGMAALSPEVFAHPDLALRLWVEDEQGVFQRLEPDQRITAAGYALMAATVPDGAISAAKLAPDALGALPGQVSGLDGRVAALEATVAGQADQIAALQDEVAALSSAGGGMFPGLTAASISAADPELVGRGFEPFARLPAPGWQDLPAAGAPSARTGHVAVWTGRWLIIWGGEVAPGRAVRTGAMYDPAAARWTPISPVDAPQARSGAGAVWTGSEMLVWGGGAAAGFPDAGGRFDPEQQRWRSLPPGPAGRVDHAALWTGRRLLVWGGRNMSGLLNDGASFDPASGRWSLLPLAGAPAPRAGAAAAWAGDRLVVWGGEGAGGPLADGAMLLFDATGEPVGWQPLTPTHSPRARIAPAAVWTGGRFLVWGGRDASGAPLGDGAAYDPASDTWSPLPAEGAPTPRTGETAVWSGREWLIVTGQTATGETAGGAAYDPEANAWRPLGGTGTPRARSDAAAVWTGAALLVFGGRAGGERLAALQQLDPQPTWYLYRQP